MCEKQENIQDIPYLKKDVFGVLAQTTLNFVHVQTIIEEIKQQYINAELPILSDVCKATYERQTVVLQNLDKFDSFIVIGGKESNNTKELYSI